MHQNPPTEQELSHLRKVIQDTFGNFNEVTQILERLIRERDTLRDSQESYNDDPPIRDALGRW